MFDFFPFPEKTVLALELTKQEQKIEKTEKQT